MKLSEALTVLRNGPKDGKPFEISLACGFTPLHFETYLGAHLQRQLPDHKVSITTGLYSDLLGSVGKWSAESAGIGVVVLEWFDLDPRLGFRSLGGWGPKVLPNIVEAVRSRLALLASSLKSAGKSKIVVVTPTLPLPPAFHTVSQQASEAELSLLADVADFTRQVSEKPLIVVLSREKLNLLSPPGDRYDIRSDLNAGFPYTLPHADVLSEALADLIGMPSPKKGLITDLDDTLWLGLVGEIGASNVCWDLSGHAQMHGLYQQMLQALSDAGVLVGVASKNSPELAGEALDRPDLCVARDCLFPLEIHWEPKSRSVARILKTWNIGADSVVFVDDSPIELEEVKLAHPGIETRLFPKSDPAAFLRLLNEFRDLFGKPRLSEEDAFRAESIRSRAAVSVDDVSGDQAETLLAAAKSVMVLDFKPSAAENRLLELVNKTNQFNLNGERLEETEWAMRLQDPDMLTVAVQYTDQFGPLGKIAALQARRVDSKAEVVSWVMSCRAFSRRIEFETLRQVFETTGVEKIRFQFAATPKNAPIRDFLSGILGEQPTDGSELSKQEFFERCPPLYHHVIKEHD